jgi:UPF0755 protein
MRTRLALAGGLALLVVVGFLAGAALWGYLRFEAPGPATVETTVRIPQGLGVNTIGHQLADAGVIDSPRLFSLGVRLLSGGRPLQAGEYRFPAGVSSRQVMETMIEGRTVRRRLTVAEGLTTAEIMALLAEAEGLEGDLPPESEWPDQGTLLPETYFYSWGDSRAALLERMAGAMDEALAELWLDRAPNLPLRTPREALTLASIVEKETGVASERPRVAAVFINRLNMGMPLQSDPTVIYAVTQGKEVLGRSLTRRDLANDHPYNTYMNPGLPPGPIAHPGRAAIEAVLNPMQTDELYFVADGNGGHAFAKTLAEHNRNVARWRALMRQ